MKRFGWCALVGGLMGAVCGAQSNALSGAASRTVFDAPTKSLRKLVGAPGSWWLGAVEVTGVDFAAVSPDGTRAVIRRGGDAQSPGRWEMVRNGDGEARPEALADSEALGGRALWSRDSQRLWLWSPETRRVEEWMGWPGALRRTAVSPEAPGALTALAADRTGDRLVVLISGADGRVHHRGRSRRVWRRLLELRDAAGADYAAGRFFTFDRGGARIWAASWEGGTESWSAAGIEDPIALAAVDAGDLETVLHVASGRDRVLAQWSVARGEWTARWELPVQPTALDGFEGSLRWLRPREAAGEPAWCFGATPEWKVMFVPAPREEENR